MYHYKNDISHCLSNARTSFSPWAPILDILYNLPLGFNAFEFSPFLNNVISYGSTA